MYSTCGAHYSCNTFVHSALHRLLSAPPPPFPPPPTAVQLWIYPELVIKIRHLHHFLG